MDREFIRATRDWTNSTRSSVGFGTRDAKGRTIGAQITRVTSAFHVGGDGTMICVIGGKTEVKPGTYFEFSPQATRSGVAYGASQPFYHFASWQEREDAIERYLASAKARAEKKARIR